jgi:hypothetical protein
VSHDDRNRLAYAARRDSACLGGNHRHKLVAAFRPESSLSRRFRWAISVISRRRVRYRVEDNVKSTVKFLRMLVKMKAMISSCFDGYYRTSAWHLSCYVFGAILRRECRSSTGAKV